MNASQQDRNSLVPETAEEVTFFWQWHLHSDNLFAQRSGLFLLSETILLTVVATLSDPSNGLQKWVIGILAVIGVLLTFAWLLYCRRHEFTRRFIRSSLEHEKVPKGAIESRALKTLKGARGKSDRLSRFVLVYIPPIVTLCFWGLVAGYKML